MIYQNFRFAQRPIAATKSIRNISILALWLLKLHIHISFCIFGISMFIYAYFSFPPSSDRRRPNVLYIFWTISTFVFEFHIPHMRTHILHIILDGPVDYYYCPALQYIKSNRSFIGIYKIVYFRMHEIGNRCGNVMVFANKSFLYLVCSMYLISGSYMYST